jgi:hypothetical protein
VFRKLARWWKRLRAPNLEKVLSGLQTEIKIYDEDSAHALDIFRRTVQELDAQNTGIREKLGVLTGHSIDVAKTMDTLATRKTENERIISKFEEFLGIKTEKSAS